MNENKKTPEFKASEEGLIFEISKEGRRGYCIAPSELDRDPSATIPKRYLRQEPLPLPQTSEPDVVRHFTRLASLNYSKDGGFYPLGSCTMKYNPKAYEYIASYANFEDTHPYQPEETCQGNLEILYEMEQFLAEISGMDAVSLAPAAGAHGELTGMLIIRAYHLSKGNLRTKVLIPDTAHGTNPASTAICGYKVVEIKSDKNGMINPNDVERLVDEETAAIMITNPNTLGIFEAHIDEIADIIHKKGGLVYMDGANLNAIMGISRPGDFGVDVMHFNLHKTFATPHGGGGPGSGPVGVKKELEPFLPIPRIAKESEGFRFIYDRPLSIGRVKTFYGNFSVILRAYAYIREMGGEGLRLASEMAVLNSNYIRSKLKNHYHQSYTTDTLHECVFSDKYQQQYGVKTLDIAKRLMDYGLHPPTIYFPLIVHGAIMIEPTETESKDACDEFINAMISIAKECEAAPEIVKGAPYTTPRRRLDEAGAVREPRLKW